MDQDLDSIQARVASLKARKQEQKVDQQAKIEEALKVETTSASPEEGSACCDECPPNAQYGLCRMPTDVMNLLVSPASGGNEAEPSDWECQHCCYLNPPEALECNACGMPAESEPESEWECDACCYINTPELTECFACGSARDGGGDGVNPLNYSFPDETYAQRLERVILLDKELAAEMNSAKAYNPVEAYKKKKMEELWERAQKERLERAEEAAKEAEEQAKQVATPKFERKFRQLDKDDSGGLDALEAEGEYSASQALIELCTQTELEELCRWTYMSFGHELDEDEAADEALKLMKKLDVNKDGIISLDEFKNYFEAQAAQTAKVAAKMIAKGKAPPCDMFNAE